MSIWHSLSSPVQDEILFQLPIKHIISLCQIKIFSCNQGITEFNKEDDFWKLYFAINPYIFLEYKAKNSTYPIKAELIKNHILIEAARMGSILGVKQALVRGADIHASSYLGPDTVLIEAAKDGYVEIVDLLLNPKKYGINSESANVHASHKSLSWAARYGHEIIVSLLLKNGADVNGENSSALREAASYGHEAIVRLLLENGADINADQGLKSLASAASHGHETIVRLLLKENFSVDAKTSALFWAVKNNYLSIASLLIENGADIHDENDLFLRMAASNGNEAMVRLFLEKGNYVRGEGFFGPDLGLREAKRHGHDKIVSLLLAPPQGPGADPDFSTTRIPYLIT